MELARSPPIRSRKVVAPSGGIGCRAIQVLTTRVMTHGGEHPGYYAPDRRFVCGPGRWSFAEYPCSPNAG
jgi:hypothetical protein